MTEFKEGDRVRIVSTSATHSSHYYTSRMHPVGAEFTVAGVGKYHSGPFVEDDDSFYWHPDDLVLVTEPAPLKEGDAVLVWAKVVDPKPDSDGDLTLSTPTGDGRDDIFCARPDAVVRPGEGQVPPWVQVATERVAMIAKTLMAEGGMDHDAAFKTAESLDRAGIRVTEEESNE